MLLAWTTQRWQGFALALFLPVMILTCLGAAYLESSGNGWKNVGPLLLFLGVLTLLNAPFDWASLGLTRALLRRGLELEGWWPYLLALVDALLAAVIVAALALVMVIGVQAFDELAVHGGGKPVLSKPIQSSTATGKSSTSASFGIGTIKQSPRSPSHRGWPTSRSTSGASPTLSTLDTLFDDIAKHPAAPEYWWAYALLLSSMIPSLINLAIGGMALTRGISGLPRLLLLWTPEGRDVPEYKRPFVAAGLTLQMFGGAVLGIAAQAFLIWGPIFHLMLWIGLNLLDMARAVVAFDFPARIGTLFAGVA